MASSTLLLMVMAACVTLHAVTACKITKVVSLESWNYVYYERSWSHIGVMLDMQLVKEHTEEQLCQSNVTFGFYGSTTWVDEGCRGDFELTMDEAMIYPPTADHYKETRFADLTQQVNDAAANTETLTLRVGAQSKLIADLTSLVANLTKGKSTLTASTSDPTDGDNVVLTCGHDPDMDDITSYEFFKDDVSLVDSASATYSLTPLTYPDDGVFTCVAKAGAVAYVESNEADLTLIPKTTTIEFESGLFAMANTDVTLVCPSSSTITSQPAYTFYRNGVLIAHGGSYGHVIDGIQMSENGAVYTCTITLNEKESSMSEGLTMVVIDICSTYADKNNADPESSPPCSSYYTCTGGKVSAGPITCPNSALFNPMFGECDVNMTECF